jgi:small-conductance mechanosensitive channel
MAKTKPVMHSDAAYGAYTWRRVAFLAASVALAAVAYGQDSKEHWLGNTSIWEGRSVAFFLFLVFCAIAAYELAGLVIQGMIRLQRGALSEVRMLTSFMRVVTVLVVIAMFLYSTGKLQALGTIVGAFAGMLLGWSLQAPVSGMAAWALVTLKRPFRIGDRVQFPSLGLNGDVLEMGLMYTKLDQVGGAIGSEDAIGRHILIPNAMLFSQVAINYTPEHRAAYFLDEVVIRLTYDSDWNEAERILLSAAREVSAEIIRQTGREPYIRSDIYDYGVYMRLRYMTAAMDRPRVSHEILKRIFLEFQRNPKVDFAIPFLYSYRKGVEIASRSTPGPEAISELVVQNIDDPQGQTPLSEDDRKGVEELAQRIQKMGLLQPIVVRRKSNGRYEVIAGRFRLLACRQLGWSAIPAIIRRGTTMAFDSLEYPDG